MSWSYSGNPAASAKDEVRFIVGDVNVQDPWRLQDEEIQYALGLYSDTPPVIGRNFLAAAVCAETILSKLKGSLINGRIGDLSTSYSTQALTFFEQTACRLRARANLQGVPLWFGGQSRTAKEMLNEDPDRLRPAFEVDGMSKVSNQPDVGKGF